MERTQVQVATQRLRDMDIYEPYIEEFKNKNTVCLFEGFIGFWAWQRQEVMEKIKEIESTYDLKVYAVTHEYSDFGELYDFLIVSNNPEEQEYEFERIDKKTFNAYAYVWNKSDDMCSEFGSIGLIAEFGGLKRYA